MVLSNLVIVSSILYLLLVGTASVATFLLCLHLVKQNKKIDSVMRSNFSYYEGEVREATTSAFDQRIEKMKEELANYTADAREVQRADVREALIIRDEAVILHPGVYNLPHDEHDKEVQRKLEEAEEYAE